MQASLVAHLVKNLPAMQETWVRSLGWDDPLEKGTATHSSILAWRTPWTTVGLKLNIHKTKIMASGAITSWQIDGETMETVTDFILGAPKSLQMVTAAIKLKDTCSLEEKLWSASVQFSCSVMSNSLWPHGLQQARPPCLSLTPGACLNSCSLSRWCHPAISSSVVPFSTHLQSFPASGSFPLSQFFTSGGQSIGVSTSASVLLMNI